jgi:gp16 family phage-associated protein
MTKNVEEVKKIFRERGITISAWSEHNGFNKAVVYQVLSGSRMPVRGESFRAAMALGLVEERSQNFLEVNELLKSKRG